MQRPFLTPLDVPCVRCQLPNFPSPSPPRAKSLHLNSLPDRRYPIFARCPLRRISPLWRRIHREGKNPRKSSIGELCEKAEPSQYASLPSSTGKPATWPLNTTPLSPSSSLIFSNGCPGPSSAPASRSAARNLAPLPLLPSIPLPLLRQPHQPRQHSEPCYPRQHCQPR